MEKTNQKVLCFIVAFALAIIGAGCVAPHMAGADKHVTKQTKEGVESQQSQDIELGNGMVLHSEAPGNEFPGFSCPHVKNEQQENPGRSRKRPSNPSSLPPGPGLNPCHPSKTTIPEYDQRQGPNAAKPARARKPATTPRGIDSST